MNHAILKDLVRVKGRIDDLQAQQNRDKIRQSQLEMLFDEYQSLVKLVRIC